MNKLKTLGFVLSGLLVSTATPVAAAPVLKMDIEVASAIVTAGDLFTDAGINAERAMFRAPAPGTAGAVSLAAVRKAAARIGITNFENPGISRVRVERTAIKIDEPILKGLILADLTRRGIVTGGVIAEMAFERSFEPTYAALSNEPVRLTDLRYAPGSGVFSARFEIAGLEKPYDLRGRLDLMIEVPHLTGSLQTGAILSRSDIELRKVLLSYAEASGFATIDQLIGMELQRPSRNGMMLRASDVTEPRLIRRSEMITYQYKTGLLTLTVKGQALNDAAKGEPVAVLNLATKKIIHGVATSNGMVEMNADTGAQS